MPDLTVAELARRHNVARSTMGRALRGGRATADGGGPADPGRPQPVNPGEPQLRYRSDEVDAWWPTRPGLGRRPDPQTPARPRREPAG